VNKKLEETIRECMKENPHTFGSFERATNKEKFNAWLVWEGMLGWDSSIIYTIEQIWGIKL